MKNIQAIKSERKAIVVGASSGIGRGLAETLIRNGYHVGITGRREERLMALKDRYPDKVEVSCFDITDHNRTIQCLDNLIDKLQGLDLFIFSSGQGATNGNLSFLIDYKVIKVNILGFTNAMTH
ncbi:MAG TPA: SDR family NAD(P)-dependent oxidoreductase, partial [Bacteroidales bacterium]|nr:SDR family NAD(P)-dependent oxidoreductase [Bacteroidales bacterium]